MSFRVAMLGCDFRLALEISGLVTRIVLFKLHTIITNIVSIRNCYCHLNLMYFLKIRQLHHTATTDSLSGNP